MKKIEKAINNLDEISKNSIESLVHSLETIDPLRNALKQVADKIW